ncbi:MAG: hypothetical protein JNM17_14050 [Archangium sp.]|nr:hypothetical protein [Archangium sp.]
MSADAFLSTWAALTKELTELIDAALDVEPPGGLPDSWAARLKSLGVAPLGEDARIAAIKEHQQTRGAPLPEVSACLANFTMLAKKQLEPLRKTLTAEQARAMEDGVHRFTDQALGHYRAKATEKKKGMFGAAKALAAQHQYGKGLNATAYVLGCSACHAPRLADELSCAFCGGSLEVVS